MLPFDQNKRQPMVVSSGSESLEGAAVERVMSRFVNAVQAGNVAEAIEAWKTLCILGDMDD